GYLDQKLRQNRERYSRKLEEIRRDPDLNDGAKARRIEPLYREARAEEAKLKQQRRAGFEEKALRAGREALGAPPMHGADPALREMNYRSALLAVADVSDPSKLSALLEMAHDTGDKTLARAVAYRANGLRNDGLVRRYLDADEAARKTWEKWGQAHEELERESTLSGQLASGVADIEEPGELRMGGVGAA
ncbi:MAG: hypothetical protein CYG60_01035, partial [Actinobacteria bacterium]